MSRFQPPPGTPLPVAGPDIASDDRRRRSLMRLGRWGIVLVLVAILVAAPSIIGLLSRSSAAGTDAMTASDVLAKINSSTHTPWSGLAESRGGLALPETTVLSDLVDLAGGTTTMRAWWTGDLSWRVDELSPVGEKDTIRDDAGTWQWDYQAGRATRTNIPAETGVHIPTSYDLLPPQLGTRLASEATGAEASRLGGQSIAGRDTVGVRITPSQPQSTIARVDIWADVDTGVPVRVNVYADAAATPVMATTFLDVSLSRPSDADIAFSPPDGAKISMDRDQAQSDIVAAIDRYARIRPPSELAGLDRSDRTQGIGAVGVYGRGVTELVAVPLLERYTGAIRTQIAATSTAVTAADGRITLGVGPLNLLITPPDSRGRFWLLAGTITPDTLTAAADDLDAAGDLRTGAPR